MRDLEEYVLNSLNIRPTLYYRYVDNIILAAPKEKIHIKQIQIQYLNKFNSYHYRLKFTLETEINHRLGFLDITLIIKNSRIITDWFHKNTFSEEDTYHSSRTTLATKWVLFTVLWTVQLNIASIIPRKES